MAWVCFANCASPKTIGFFCNLPVRVEAAERHEVCFFRVYRLAFFKAHTGAAAVLADELDTRRFQNAPAFAGEPNS